MSGKGSAKRVEADVPQPTPAIPTTGARIPVLRVLLFLAACGGFLFFTLLCGIVGLWGSPIGKDYLHETWLKDRAALVGIPKAQRGLVWRLHSLASTVAFDLPGFIVGFKADRAKMYGATAELTKSEPAGFKDSIMSFSFEAVSATLNALDQPRGMYLGNAKVPPECMGADTLIFQSTGKTHSAMRRVLTEAIPAFTTPLAGNSDPASKILDLDFGEDGEHSALQLGKMSAAESDDLLRRTLVRTLFKTIFKAPISPTGLKALMEYPPVGGTCVLGEDFHKLTGGLILQKVVKLRRDIYEAISQTPVGAAVKAAAAAAVAAGELPGSTDEEKSGDALVRQLADGVAFAGTLGTTHLTTHALARIRSAPQFYVPLFLKDPLAFLHEEARVDPPVTSVTSVLRENATFTLLGGVRVALEAGQPYQDVISTANMDPSVFGGPHHSREYAHSFNPHRANMGEVLSWNGRLKDVAQGTAPRGCPGYRLSMALAQSLVTKFAPSASQVPRSLDPDSTAAAASLPGIPAIKSKPRPAVATAASGFDKAGFVLWLVCSVAGCGWLLGKGQLGSVSVRYVHYLAGQAFIALGSLYESDFCFVQGQAAAGIAYGLIFITTICQGQPALGWFLSSVLWCTFASLVVAVTVIAYAGKQSGLDAMKLPVFVFYGLNSACGLLTVVRFYLHCCGEERKGAKERISAARWGLVGGLFGVADLLLVYVPVYGHLLSRTFDTFFYIQLVLPAIKAMDAVYPSSDVVLPNNWLIKKGLAAMSVIVVVVSVALALAWARLASGDICAFQVPYPTPDAAHYHLCKGTPLSRVDPYGRAMFSVSRSIIEGLSTAAAQAEAESPLAILVPKYDKKLPRAEVIEGSGYTIPLLDEDVEDSPSGGFFYNLASDLLMNKILRSPLLFPIHDNPETWTDMDQGRLALKIAGGDHLPPPVSDWNGVDVTSDAALSQMVFAGLAGSRVELVSSPKDDKDGAVFKVDFSEMVQFDTRQGYEPFGATAYFDENAKLLRIFWAHAGVDVYPSSPDWAHAKWVFRSSALVGITVVEHLIENHLIFSNLASTASRESAPRDHPIRRLLKPFNHRTPSINMGARDLLTTEWCLLHRTTSLTWNGLNEAFRFGLRHIRYSANPVGKHRAALAKLGDKFPYARDGLDFQNIVANFATSYRKIYYETAAALHSDESLAKFYDGVRVFGDSSGLPRFQNLTLEGFDDIIAGYIFHVTAFHHVVGNVAEYLLQPNFAAARIRPSHEVSDAEASMYGLLVAVLTGAKAPFLMSNFEHLLLQDEHLPATTAVLRGFQKNLTEFAEEIDRRNDKRRAEGRWTYNGFDPRRLLSSVSI